MQKVIPYNDLLKAADEIMTESDNWANEIDVLTKYMEDNMSHYTKIQREFAAEHIGQLIKNRIL